MITLSSINTCVCCPHGGLGEILEFCGAVRREVNIQTNIMMDGGRAQYRAFHLKRDGRYDHILVFIPGSRHMGL